MTWIVCAGMIRSGSTLQFQLASRIVVKAGVGIRLPFVEPGQFEAVYLETDGQKRLKVFKSHVCTGRLYDLSRSGEIAVIYSYRDIRDVAVSAMKKFGKSFGELLQNGWLDQAIIDYHLWKSMPNLLISKYEEFKFNIEQEANRINSFLGKLLDMDSIKTIAGDHEVSRQVRRISALKSAIGRDIGPDEIAYDPSEQLHHNHIEDGAIGKWKQFLSSSQIVFLNTRFGNWLIDSGYENSEELSLQCQKAFPTVSVSELSEYWRLSSTSAVARIERSEVALRAEKEQTQQIGMWAERTEAMLKSEQENAFELRRWAERSDTALQAEKEQTRQMRMWAERTEALLKEEKETALELRRWVEQSEIVLQAEKELTQQMRMWAERTEALLKAERELAEQRTEPPESESGSLQDLVNATKS